MQILWSGLSHALIKVDVVTNRLKSEKKLRWKDKNPNFPAVSFSWRSFYGAPMLTNHSEKKTESMHYTRNS